MITEETTPNHLSHKLGGSARVSENKRSPGGECPSCTLKTLVRVCPEDAGTKNLSKIKAPSSILTHIPRKGSFISSNSFNTEIKRLVSSDYPISVLVPNPNTIVLKPREEKFSREKDREFIFDGVFPPTASQDEVFQTISSDVVEVVGGVNTTLLCYGASKSGKTYSLEGTERDPGIIWRSLKEVFARIEMMQNSNPEIHFYAELSYVELYNNNFRNLLNPQLDQYEAPSRFVASTRKSTGGSTGRGASKIGKNSAKPPRSTGIGCHSQDEEVMIVGDEDLEDLFSNRLLGRLTIKGKSGSSSSAPPTALKPDGSHSLAQDRGENDDTNVAHAIEIESEEEEEEEEEEEKRQEKKKKDDGCVSTATGTVVERMNATSTETAISHQTSCLNVISEPAADAGSELPDQPIADPGSELPDQPIADPGSELPDQPIADPGSELPDQPIADPGSELPDQPIADPGSELPDQPIADPGSELPDQPIADPGSELPDQPIADPGSELPHQPIPEYALSDPLSSDSEAALRAANSTSNGDCGGSIIISTARPSDAISLLKSSTLTSSNDAICNVESTDPGLLIQQRKEDGKVGQVAAELRTDLMHRSNSKSSTRESPRGTPRTSPRGSPRGSLTALGYASGSKSRSKAAIGRGNNSRIVSHFGSQATAGVVGAPPAVTVAMGRSSTPTKSSARPHTAALHSSPYTAGTFEKLEIHESELTGTFLSSSSSSSSGTGGEGGGEDRASVRVPVQSAEDAWELYRRGSRHRASGVTATGHVCHRSHAVLMLHLESRNFGPAIAASLASTPVSSVEQDQQREGEGNFTFSFRKPALWDGYDTVSHDPAAAAAAAANGSGAAMASSSTYHHQQQRGMPSLLTVAKLQIVDLAGADKLELSGAEGESLVESQHINLSLKALGDVLQTLSRNAAAKSRHMRRRRRSFVAGDGLRSESGSGTQTAAVTVSTKEPIAGESRAGTAAAAADVDYGNDVEKKAASSLTSVKTSPSSMPQFNASVNAVAIPTVKTMHVPYLNNKLTHLLKDGLGGNSKTVLLVHVHRTAEHWSLTQTSLQYASWAKEVRTRPRVNIIDTAGHAWRAETDPELQHMKKVIENRSMEVGVHKLLQIQSLLESTGNYPGALQLQSLGLECGPGSKYGKLHVFTPSHANETPNMFSSTSDGGGENSEGKVVGYATEASAVCSEIGNGEGVTASIEKEIDSKNSDDKDDDGDLITGDSEEKSEQPSPTLAKQASFLSTGGFLGSFLQSVFMSGDAPQPPQPPPSPPISGISLDDDGAGAGAGSGIEVDVVAGQLTTDASTIKSSDGPPSDVATAGSIDGNFSLGDPANQKKEQSSAPSLSSSSSSSSSFLLTRPPLPAGIGSNRPANSPFAEIDRLKYLLSAAEARLAASSLICNNLRFENAILADKAATAEEKQRMVEQQTATLERKIASRKESGRIKPPRQSDTLSRANSGLRSPSASETASLAGGSLSRGSSFMSNGGRTFPSISEKARSGRWKLSRGNGFMKRQSGVLTADAEAGADLGAGADYGAVGAEATDEAHKVEESMISFGSLDVSGDDISPIAGKQHESDTVDDVLGSELDDLDVGIGNGAGTDESQQMPLSTAAPSSPSQVPSVSVNGAVAADKEEADEEEARLKELEQAELETAAAAATKEQLEKKLALMQAEVHKAVEAAELVQISADAAQQQLTRQLKEARGEVWACFVLFIALLAFMAMYRHLKSPFV